MGNEHLLCSFAFITERHAAEELAVAATVGSANGMVPPPVTKDNSQGNL